MQEDLAPPSTETAGRVIAFTISRPDQRLVECAMNRGEFPARGVEANRRDEQVRVTELLCFHLDLLSSVPFPFRLQIPDSVRQRSRTDPALSSR